MSHRHIGRMVAGLVFALAANAAHANDYPSRAIRLIVPYSAGGPAAIVSRGYANELSKALDQTIVVENRPGAGTAIGTQAAKQSPAYGYSLLFATAGMFPPCWV